MSKRTIKPASSIRINVKDDFVKKWTELCGEEAIEAIPHVEFNELAGSLTRQSTEDSILKVEAPALPFLRITMPKTDEIELQVIGPCISEGFCNALCSIVPLYLSLTVLKLTNCSLVAESMHMLAFLLKQETGVTRLHLDENVIPDENYYLLLKDSKQLLHLSLRLCEITDKGAKLLAAELKVANPPHQSLYSLNLSGNMIRNEGAAALADALRLNRTLNWLSLAGNQLRDPGAEALAQSFLPFELTDQELQVRGSKLMDRLNLLRHHMDEYKDPSREDKVPSTSTSKKKTADHSADQDIYAGPGPGPPPSHGSAPKDVMNYYYALEKHAFDSLPMEDRPLVTEVFLNEDGKKYMSQGNDSLWYLNLSYNVLTEKSLQTFVKVFQHQENFSNDNRRGLITFYYQGNEVIPGGDVDLALSAKRSSSTSSPSKPRRLSNQSFQVHN